MMVESEVCTTEVLSVPVEEVAQSVDIVVEADQVLEAPLKREMTPPSVTSSFGEIKNLYCRSEKLNLNFNVHVENESINSSQRCFIMTLHDIGFDYTRYQELISCEKMSDVRNRTVWIHVDMPGQEPEAADLKLKKYPSMEEIADELVCVVDHLKIPQVICVGDGTGANLATYFALKHPKRCLGIVLVQPASFSAGLIDTIKQKVHNMNSVISLPKITTPDRTNFLMKRLDKRGSSNDSENEVLQQSINKIIIENQNAKNLALFQEAFVNRSSLADQIKDLKVDVLIAIGKNSPSHSDAKKFYKSLQDVRRKNIKDMVNSPFLELDGVSDVLKESPERLAVSLQYFLQGIGLLSAIPMKNILRSMSSSTSSYGRSVSIESSEQQTNSSQSEFNSQNVSSNQSLNE